MSTEPSPGLGYRTLAGLGLLGAVARAFNLGTYSLWLDEVLLIQRASAGCLADVWRACRANAEHPPLSALVSALTLDASGSETLLRLVHAAAGLAAALLITEWAALAFGRRTGLAAGLAFAASPFAVRYSQEIRPYAFLLLAAGATLWWLERGRRGDAGPRWPVGLALIMATGLYSHYLYLLTFVPLAWTLAETVWLGTASERAAATRFAARTGVAAAGALGLFLPWLGTAGTAAALPPPGGTADWNVASALRRLHFLLAGGKEGEAVTVGGLFCAALVAAGCLAALRGRPGRGLLAGALAGTVGIEITLLVRDHWSNARYDVAGWMFLVVLLGLGADRGFRRPAAFAVAVALIVASCLAGLLRYDRTGRPDWDRVAAAVAALRRPGEALLAENHWTRESLAHYLATEAIVAAGASPAEAAASWPAGRCVLLVTSGYPPVPPLRQLARSRPLLAAFPASEARIALLGPGDREALERIVDGAPPPATGPCPDPERRLPFELRQPRRGRVDRLLDPVVAAIRRRLAGGVWSLEFDAASARHLDHGWSTFETGAEGKTFVWAIGGASSARFDLGAPADREVEIHLWPYRAETRPQELTLVVNGAPLPPRPLGGGWQVVVTAVPADLWHRGPNEIVFRFSHTVAPRDVDPASTDARPLTAAFDRLVVRPATP